MSALTDLLDQAVQKCEPANDAALAVRLGVSRSAISLWRKGEGIREKHLTQLISAVGADPEVAVLVLREQATTHAERAVWGALARKLGAAAAVVAVAVIALPLMAANDGHYSALLLGLAVPQQLLPYALCEVMCRWRRATARRLQQLRSLLSSDGFDEQTTLLA